MENGKIGMTGSVIPEVTYTKFSTHDYNAALIQYAEIQNNWMGRTFQNVPLTLFYFCVLP